MRIKLVKKTFFKETETKKKLANFIIQARFLSMGEETKKFEESFAKKQERKFAVMTSSGSAANLLLLQAFKNIGYLKNGDKIGVSSITWSTNIFPIMQLGMTPVILDSEINTLNVSPATLKKKISGLDALFLTNVLGFCDNLGEIAELCWDNKILFFEDNCESLGSKFQGKLLGNFGEAATFSFYVAHHISTIEGGMVVTDNEDLYHELLIARAHGWDRDLPEKKQKELRLASNANEFFSQFTFYRLAYNLRPTDIQGFLGNDQLQYWDKIVSIRAENFEKFNRAIGSNGDLIPIKADHMEVVSNFTVPVIAKTKELHDYYKKLFTDSDVEIRPIIAGNISRHPYWKGENGNDLEGANFIHENGFYFTNNPDLNEEEIKYLINLLRR
ncbi:hypothetical protein A2Z63_01085 [Candidatus Giovannonibacteria bacterium RIFCSPLOWO2_02_44_8]|uniref:DegT/DnrJ/EryC1/StrS aminotransferase n=1 Tax=Candidatus Giovannonibacteria bacterium RIFCSPLOWO2_02_44_8 TaxID=1798355 RepID=A0A1F5XCS4_9BACT|nr:MAG: hypothetical protein A2Z63_01085 [Candidatus Giovannonibacteria bacterium RIFCSPLOWO2_02_44_8]